MTRILRATLVGVVALTILAPPAGAAKEPIGWSEFKQNRVAEVVDLRDRLHFPKVLPSVIDDAREKYETWQEAWSNHLHYKAERAAAAEVAVEQEAPAAPTTEPVSYSGSIQEIIVAAAEEFGVDPGWMLSIASCESGFNPRAYNGAGPYYGLFQYDSTTWAGYGYGSIYDPVAQSRTTARLLAMGQSSRWPNCA